MWKKSNSKSMLHWTCNSPSHYNAFLFQSLFNSGINLLVHYRKASISSHPWKTSMQVGYKNRVQTFFCGIDVKLLKIVIANKKIRIVFGGWSDFSSIFIIFVCIILKRKYLIWTDTPNTSRNRKWYYNYCRNLLLQFIFKGAYLVMGTGFPAIEVLSKMGVPNNKLVNFPYWININSLKPTSITKKPQSHLRFLSSGQIINSKKGHDIAIRSLAKVYDLIQIDFEYIIAGTGPDLDFNINLSSRLGIADKVKFIGWHEPEELINIFHDSDALIHPSPTHEPYGVAVIEAMAASLIVFSSDTTCAGLDRITNQYNGFIHSAGDIESLCRQIIWLINNLNKMYEIKFNARKTAENWPIERGIDIIKKII